MDAVVSPVPSSPAKFCPQQNNPALRIAQEGGTGRDQISLFAQHHARTILFCIAAAECECCQEQHPKS
jgi:hypothetical protein